MITKTTFHPNSSLPETPITYYLYYTMKRRDPSRSALFPFRQHAGGYAKKYGSLPLPQRTV
ncbi:hypothetical protein HMPREF0889_0667 [Megasphaera lornae]|uniref:Uncharacterized protein n=1 Tax=Megasphaera lornae TaxID=1000568 RepID=D3LWL1_9FIRM|nr:hypothetical protein HMPREF0889_0667 [Megasphaera genomosp. type_1 str. 28L]MUP49863.1 hypothetical protein [Veillonellaceae bacterium M1-70]